MPTVRMGGEYFMMVFGRGAAVGALAVLAVALPASAETRQVIPGGSAPLAKTERSAPSSTSPAKTAPSLVIRAQPNLVRLVAFDACPYVCSSEADGGALVARVRAAYEAVGKKADIIVKPTASDAYAMLERDEVIAGVLPAYGEPTVDHDLSEPLGVTQFALVERADAPVDSIDLVDLALKQIGIQVDLPIPFTLREAVDKGIVRLTIAENTDAALGALVTKKTDAVIVDRRRYEWARADLTGSAATVVYSKVPIIEEASLHVAFAWTRTGAIAGAALRDGLAALPADERLATLPERMEEFPAEGTRSDASSEGRN